MEFTTLLVKNQVFRLEEFKDIHCKVADATCKADIQSDEITSEQEKIISVDEETQMYFLICLSSLRK